MPFSLNVWYFESRISPKPNVMVYLERSEHEGERLVHRLISLKYDTVKAELLWVQQRAFNSGYHPNNKLRDFE